MARARPVDRLPQKGERIDRTAGVSLPRDLVDLLDDTVFRNQPRERGIRLFTLNTKPKPTTSGGRSLQMSGTIGAGCAFEVYFLFSTPDDSVYFGTDAVFVFSFNLPVCVEFNPDWLANFLANFPPIAGGTSAGCAAYASMCYLIDGDDANVVSYATGENGLYTVDPTNCQNVGSGWFSTTDSQPCSPWQVFFYDGVYTGNTRDVPISFPVSVWYELASANSDYPSGGPPNTPVLNGGHLYVALWGFGLPFSNNVIQGGKNKTGDGKLDYIPGPQGNASIDYRAPLALSPNNAAAVYLHLQSLASTYKSNYLAGKAPYYNFIVCNSNRWAHNLMNADGFSELQLDYYEFALAQISLNTRVPYGGFGLGLCDLTPYFLGSV